MKFCVVISLFVLSTVVTAAFNKKSPEDSARFISDCYIKLNIPKDLQEKKFPDDELIHKHVRCVAEKFETWNEKDGFVPELMKAQFGENKSDILDLCLTERNPTWTVEKWAWDNWKCLDGHGINKP